MVERNIFSSYASYIARVHIFQLLVPDMQQVVQIVNIDLLGLSSFRWAVDIFINDHFQLN